MWDGPNQKTHHHSLNAKLRIMYVTQKFTNSSLVFGFKIPAINRLRFELWYHVMNILLKTELNNFRTVYLRRNR